MWEGIDKDQAPKEDVTLIAESMRNNTLIWVTDGSYDRKKAKELSGDGWIIFCTKTGLRLMGAFWEKSNTASSFWVEMLGLCTLHLFTQAVAEFYKVE
jgi:hypothetical protein